MKVRHTRRDSRRSGFTIVELVIVAALGAIVIGFVTMLGLTSGQAYQTGATLAELERQGGIVTDRIVNELRTVAVDTLDPDPLEGFGAREVEYDRPTGFEAGHTNWSRRRIAFEYMDGELDDGIDNNGNGLVDEGRIVLTEDVGGPAERRLVLTRWVSELLEGELPNGVDDNGNGLVDEPGFVIERTGETLLVRLTLQRLDARNRLVSRTSSTSTKVRNRRNGST